MPRQSFCHSTPIDRDRGFPDRVSDALENRGHDNFVMFFKLEISILIAVLAIALAIAPMLEGINLSTLLK
jgi:hypothetical protein